MYIDIITPEETILKGEVDSVIVPGKKGEFQMLTHHDAIVSTLAKGNIKIYTHKSSQIEIQSEKVFKSQGDDKVLLYPVKNGIIELKDDKIIILAN